MADVAPDLAELRRLHEAAVVQPRGEWFVASREDDDEHPWWLFSYEKCAAGDECDHDECTAVPVVALCPYDDTLATDERVAEWAAAAFNALPWLLDRAAAVVVWRLLAERALDLAMYGEGAPGMTDTWQKLEADMRERAALDGSGVAE